MIWLIVLASFMSGACAYSAAVTYFMMIDDWRPYAILSLVGIVFAGMFASVS
jgi:hypothetical protein